MPEFVIVKAVILSGGKGKRLRPITDYMPKPLVPVCDIPIIEWQIRYFKKFGIKEIIICAGYLSEQIINYLETKDFGIKIQYSIERVPLGTGGALKKAQKYIDEKNFFVINGDVITNIDFRKLKTHANSIAVIPLRTTFGVVHIVDNQVKRFEEKPEISSHWMNTGIYYLNKDIFKYLPRKGNIENTLFPLLAQKGELNAMKYTKVFWQSIDSHKDMEECVNGMKEIRYENFISKL